MATLTIAGGLKAVKDLDSAVGVILKFVARLGPDKSGAALRMSNALGQVRASCDALDRAATAYAVLGYSDPATLPTSPSLHELRGGRLKADIERGFGGCSMFSEIYNLDLSRWLARIFKPDEQQELGNAFANLANADSGMFDGMREAALLLQRSADEAVKLIDQGKAQEARDHIRANGSDIELLRAAVNEVLANIEKINADLIKAGLR